MILSTLIAALINSQSITNISESTQITPSSTQESCRVIHKGCGRRS
jgi:hypothetical protein